MAEGFDAGSVVGRMVLAHEELGRSLAEIKKGVASAANESEKATDQASKGWGKFGTALKAISFVAIAKGVWDFGKQAFTAFAKTSQGITAADNMLKKHGTSWDKLKDRVSEATGGMMSELDQLQQFNKGLALGIKPDELIELMEISKTAARAFGEDVGYMTESIVTGVGRQSKLWLDNLGIIIDVEGANKRYAESIGKNVSTLTEQEKKQAFINATLEQGKQLMKEIGSDGTNAAEAIQKLAASWEDFKTMVGSFSEILGAGEATNFWAEQLRSVVNWMKEWIGLYVAMRREVAKDKVTAASRAELEKRARDYEDFKKKRESLEREDAKARSGELAPSGPGQAGFVETPGQTEDRAKKLEAVRTLEANALISVNDQRQEYLDLEWGKEPGGGGTPPPTPPGGGSKEDPRVKTAEDTLAALQELGRSDVERIEAEHAERQKALEAGALSEADIQDGSLENDRQRLEAYRQLAQQRVQQAEQEAQDKAAMLDLSYAQQEQALEEEFGSRMDLESRRLELEAQRLADQTALYESEYQRQLEILRQTITDQAMLQEEEARLKEAHDRRMIESDLERRRSSEALRRAEELEREAKVNLYSDISMAGIDLLVENEKEAAKLKGWIEVAEATRTFGQWLENPAAGNLLLSSLQHALSAKQYFKAASSSGGGSGKSGGGGGGGNNNKKKDKQGRGQDGANQGPPVSLIVNFHGAALLDETQLNNFVANQLGPAIDKLSSSGRISQSWSKK